MTSYLLQWLLFACSCAIILQTLDARKVRVRPRPQSTESDEETDTGAAEDLRRPARVQYYAAEEPQEQQQRILLVSTDDYNGLYGQQAQTRGNLQDNYIARGNHFRGEPKTQHIPQQRIKETPKAPPVQTIRNYNKVNDDGSFTFGYEAADGSFKEETRGTDCVVRGKYGYIDPDGNKREFTYVSGNPCDPNAPADDDSDERKERGKHEEEDDDSGPANYPKSFPVRPVPRPVARPATPAPTRQPVTIFQNVFGQSNEEEEEEDEPEPLQVLRPQSTPRPRLIQHPTHSYIQSSQPDRYSVQSIQPTTQSIHHSSPVTITPRPTTTKAQLPATTYRPQLVAVTPRPAQIYSEQPATLQHVYPSSTPQPLLRTPTGGIDFAAEFRKFSPEPNVIASTPKTLSKTTEKAKAPQVQYTSEPIYSSELVYDPSSGQYKTQLYQTLPQTTGDFTLNHRIQPYVAQQAPHGAPQHVIQLQPQPVYHRPVLRPEPTRAPSQQVYQQQQAEIQFQNSQQLFAQQQRARAQQAARAQGVAAPRPQPHSSHAPQQFYYIQPAGPLDNPQHQLAQGQIEAFLRSHNVNY